MKLTRLSTRNATCALTCWLTLAASAGCASSLKSQPPPSAQEPTPTTSPGSGPRAVDDDPLDDLQAKLSRPGPEGQADREAAVARLLELPRADAHRLLQQRLRDQDDPDAVRVTVLVGLQSHLLGSPTKQFGGADAELRRQLLAGYLGACAPLWANAPDVDLAVASPVRAAARRALRRVPARELAAAASTLLSSGEADDRAFTLRCLADMQQTLLAPTIAAQLEAPEAVVRAAAQKALDLLVYPDQTIRTKAEFDAWAAEYGGRSYVDLAQRSARLGPRAFQELRDQMQRMRVDAAQEFVAVHVSRRADIDWEAVQARTTSGGPAVLDACLVALQKALARSPGGDGAATARHAFFRALLDRLAQVPQSQQPDVQRRRALLLEVGAYLVKPDEAELAGEIRALLLAELAVASADGQVAALRGLRRFPSEQARQALVERGKALFVDLDNNQRQLQVILDTLAARTEPRWVAPGPDAADKLGWVALVDQSCRSAPERDLRDRGLLLAQTLDASKRYVPEAFAALRRLTEDPKLDTKFRSTCLIYLDAWRADEEIAGDWFGALLRALGDEAADLRRQAASSLARLREVNDPRRADWLKQAVEALRGRLPVEPDQAVLGALVDCMQELGREPGMSAAAIGALKQVLEGLGDPVAKEQEFRLDPLLRALATIAAGNKTSLEQWLSACEPLLIHGKRKGLRVVLQTHKANELAKDVMSDDAGAADRARRAMRLLIGTAALQPVRTDWALDANKEEARHVRAAFGALDLAPPAERLDARPHRLLRASIDLAMGKDQDVVKRVADWLADASAGDVAGDATYGDRLRLLAARAQLALSDPAAALALAEARSSAAKSEPAALALAERIAAALLDQDPPAAEQLCAQVVRATAPEDPLFRARLVAWVRCALRVPERKEAALVEAGKHAPLFDAADCPEQLRDEFRQLTSQKQAP